MDASFSFSGSEIIINVSDYSGTTDSDRIQQALDDVPEEGATVFIPKGVWVAANLSAKSKTAVLGENGTVIERPENLTFPFITFQNRTDFSVADITFDGQNIPQATGIYIENCTKFKILENMFRNISRNAIRVTGLSEQFSIQNNYFERCDNAPLILFGSPGERYIKEFTISNNFLTNGKNNGKIAVAFTANGTIADNTIINCDHGIATRCVSHLLIKNNHIEDCLNYAIYLGTQPADPGSDNLKIIGNVAVNCSIGISRWYGSQSIYNVTLEENSIFNNSQWDICLDFPAQILNNTLTSKGKLKILNSNVEFIGNRNVEGHPIIPGDINDDLKIDMKDIGLVARLFGATSSDAFWNPSADIIVDEVIDMKDIGFVARLFGFQYS